MCKLTSGALFYETNALDLSHHMELMSQLLFLKKRKERKKSFILFFHFSIMSYEVLNHIQRRSGVWLVALTRWDENTGDTQIVQQHLAYAFWCSILGLWRCNWQCVVPDCKLNDGDGPLNPGVPRWRSQKAKRSASWCIFGTFVRFQKHCILRQKGSRRMMQIN